MEISSEQQAEARAARTLRRAQQREEREREQHQRKVREATDRIVHWRDTVAWSSLAPAQRCHADGLGEMMTLLSLPEMIAAAQACRAWRAAALHAPPINGSVECANSYRDCKTDDAEVSPRLQAMIASPFRKHVGELTDTSEVYESWGIEWDVENLGMLRHLPHLQRLTHLWLGRLPDGVEVPSDIPFPPSLTEVALHPDTYARGAEMLTGVLMSLAKCSALTSLTLEGEYVECPNALMPKFDLHALVALQQLQHFAIEGVCSWHFGADTMAHVKKLANLRTLRLDWPEWMQMWEDCIEEESLREWLPALISPPHSLKNLEELPLGGEFLSSDELIQLSEMHLTRLNPAIMWVLDLPLLSRFPHLRELSIDEIESEDVEYEADNDDVLKRIYARGDGHGICGSFLLDTLQCEGLEEFELPSCSFTEEEAEAFCKKFNQLRKIQLYSAEWPSLKPLRHLKHLAEFNVSLVGDASFSLTLDDVRALSPSVRKFKLRSLPADTDAAVIAALDEDASLLPNLDPDEFEITVREPPPVEERACEHVSGEASALP